MSNFNLNLAHEYTMGQTKRHRSYWLMMIYFGLCGLLLIDTAYRVTDAYKRIRSYRVEMAVAQRQFAKTHPKSPVIEQCMSRAEQTLQLQKQKLDLLWSQTHDPAPLGECLYRFARDLPPSMRVANLTVDPTLTAHTVKLSMRIPSGPEMQNAPLEWITRWKEDPELSQIMKNMVLANRSDNKLINGRKLTEFSCTADLIRGVTP